jgi:CheY-like chemotaxis protein
MAKNKKVLLMEDERVVCELLKHVFEGNGYTFASAFNGMEGLAKIEEFSPDVIIMDVNMPQMDGWQTLSALKSSPKTSAIPVIMCTAKNAFADIEQANELGCQGYVTKPIIPERILRKVAEVLR